MRDLIERILRIPRAVLTVMVILLIAGVDEALFIVEWFQIGLFAYFWYVESRRLWDSIG